MMIWSMADLRTAQRLRDRITSPFTTRVGRNVGRGLEEAMRERFRQLAKQEELVVHPQDIVVEIEEPILGTDLIASAAFYSTIVARWEPQGRGIAFKGIGVDPPASGLFGYYNGLTQADSIFHSPDTITIELDSRAWGGELREIPTSLCGWSEEERAWVYGPKQGLSEESGDLAGNSHVRLSWTLGR